MGSWGWVVIYGWAGSYGIVGVICWVIGEEVVDWTWTYCIDCIGWATADIDGAMPDNMFYAFCGFSGIYFTKERVLLVEVVP